MAETFDPVTLQNDTGQKLNAAYFNRLENNLETFDDRIAANETLLTTVTHRVVHNGTSYPSRPSGVAAGYVEYIGPTEPTTWLNGDTWVQTA